jgi:hypothetical protein
MDRRPVISAFVLFLAGILPAGSASQATAAQGATLAAASPVAAGDFSGLVDIGGRKLYLECRGRGSPTVILEAGAYARADVWSRDNQRQAGARTMVLPGVAAFTRVCAYDRPGTIGEVNPDLDPHGPPFFPSRSDPVPQPRTTRDKVADLHALLRAADIRAPTSWLLTPRAAWWCGCMPACTRMRWWAWCCSTAPTRTSGCASRRP